MQISIKDITISNSLPFVLIAGPDSLESREHALHMANSISLITSKFGVPYIFKASYDKANRTSIDSFRGVGIKEGMNIFAEIQSKLGIQVTTDVHSPEEAAVAGRTVDLLQIPALLSRQTDLLLAAGRTGKPVNIKKGQFIAPHNIDNLYKKVTSTDNNNVMITERGTTFGYNDMVVDMRGLEIMKRFEYPVIFDASHTVQTPSGLQNTSGGDRSLIPALARAAVGVGVAGLFMEIHDDPSSAPVDGMSSLDLKDLEKLLSTLKAIDRIVKGKYE